MRKLTVTVDSVIRISRADLRSARLSPRDLRDPFSYANPEFFKKERLGFYAGDVDREITLSEIDPDELRLPRGVWPRLAPLLARHGVCPEVRDRTVSGTGAGLDFSWKAPFDLDPDQRSAAKACLRRRNGIVIGPCASGKTAVALRAISLIGERTIVLVHTERILDGWLKKATWLPGLRVGAFYGRKKDPGADVVVGMIRSVLNLVRKSPKWAHSFGCVILDEAHHCFPTGTLVGGKRIEDLRVGDVVPSFDDFTLQYDERRITATQRHVTDELLSVTVGGEEVFVTPGHPFYTEDGWRPARDLYEGCMVLRFTEPEERYHEHLRVRGTDWGQGDRKVLPRVQAEASHGPCGGGDLRLSPMRQDVPTKGAHPTRPARKRVLQRSVPRQVHLGAVVPSDAADQPEALGDPLEADAGTEPDARPEGPCAGEHHAPGDGLEAHSARGERNGSHGAPTSPGVRPRVGDGGFDQHEGPSAGVPKLLQGGRGEPGAEGGRGGGRSHPQHDPSAGEGPKEGRVPTWSRVGRVSVLERGGDGTFGGRAPGGHVYNVTVEGTETYLVGNGLAVHNCPASTFSETIQSFPAKYRLGFTATPKRKDAKEVLFFDAFGAEAKRSPRTGRETSAPRVLFEITDEMLDRFGRIMPIDVVVVPTDFYFDLNRADELRDLGWERERRESPVASVKRWASETSAPGSLHPYAEMLDELVRDRRRQARILAYLLPELAAGKPSLLLADRRELGLEVRSWLKRRKVEVGTLMGGKSRKDADRTVAALEAGTLLAAVGTTVADEGMDLGLLARGFGCTPVGSNPARLTQQFGRFKRKAEGKVDARYFYFWDRRVPGFAAHLGSVASAVKAPHRLRWSEEPGKDVPLTRRLIRELVDTAGEVTG